MKINLTVKATLVTMSSPSYEFKALIQLLTAHGCFRAYLPWFQLEGHAFCSTCGLVHEDVEHVLFLKTITEEMLASAATWRSRLCGQRDTDDDDDHDVHGAQTSGKDYERTPYDPDMSGTQYPVCPLWSDACMLDEGSAGWRNGSWCQWVEIPHTMRHVLYSVFSRVPPELRFKWKW